MTASAPPLPSRRYARTSAILARGASRSLATLAAIAAFLGGCGGDRIAGADQRVPASLDFQGSQALSATVGTIVPAPVVRVTDADGEPVIGALVRFSVSGGTLVGDSVHTSASGFASPTRWTLGGGAGAQLLTARTGTLVPATLTVTATADVPATIARHAGDARRAVAGAAVDTAPAVRVRDQFGNAVPGALVTFLVTAGGGSIPLDTARTDASGIAALASWTLGTVAGENRVSATVAALAPVTFTATGTSGTPANVQLLEGGGLSATAGTALSAAPLVRVTDANGNPVAGVLVGFATSEGSGSVATSSVATDDDGRASAGAWTLGTTAGVHSLNVTVPGLAPLMITATATAAAPASVAIQAGDGLEATAGTATAIAPAVRVTDAYGNAVGGATVSFAITAGNGTLGATSVLTGTDGIASAESWTLGTTRGANAATATVSGLAPVTFTATGVSGAAASLAIVSGDGGSARVGTTRELVVRVADQYGNGVEGLAVSWSATAGSVAAAGSATDTDGVARMTWTLGTTAGSQSATAGVPMLSGSPATFTVAATAAQPTRIAMHEGDGQVATAGAAVDIAPAVRVTDDFGNPIANVAVTFAVATGGGSVTGATTVTSDSGVATVGSWTLGTVAGSNTLSATMAGAAAVTFRASAVPGAAASLAIVSGNGGSAPVGTARELVVRAADQYGNGVEGLAVSWSANAGSVAAAGSTTDSAGTARITWTLGTTAGAQSATAGVPMVSGSPATFTVTATAAAAARLAIVQQPSDSARSGIAFARQPVIALQDQFGNTVAQAGVAVTVTIASGSPALGGTTTVSTTAAGAATFGDLAITGAAGARTLAFGSSGLTGVTSAAITLSAGTASAATSVLSTDDASLRADGTTFTTVRLRLRDAQGNALASGAGHAVSFATTAGTLGSVSDAGDGSFTARLTSPTTVGSATVTATLDGGPVASTATVAFVAGPVQSFRVERAGGGEIGFAGAGSAFQVQVTALDAYGNRATTFGGTVDFSTDPAGAITAGATSAAFASGLLASHAITIGAAGSYTLSATRSTGTETGTSAAFAVDAAPTIVAVAPALNATGVSRTAPITLTFSEPVNAVSASFSLQCPAGTAQAFTLSASPATSFTLTPVAALPGSTTCVVRTSVAGGAITDVDAYDPPDGIADQVWAQFTTASAISAIDDDWSADSTKFVTGNVIFESNRAATPFSPTDNDTLPASAIVSWAGYISGGTGSAGGTERGGSIMVIAGDGPARGRFLYAPPAGFEGVDRFQYVVVDGASADTATVSLRVSGMVWFIDNGAQACTTRAMGCGRLDLPYSSLAAFQAENNGVGDNPGPNDDIFVFERATAYTGRVTLLAGQKLIGQDATQSLSQITGIVPTSGSRAFPAMSPGNATTVRLTAADDVVRLGTDNTVRGLTLLPTNEMSGAGIGGSNFGTLTLAGDVSVNGVPASAVVLSNGTIAGSFASVRSTNGVAGAVSLTNVGTLGTTTFGVATDTLRSTMGAVLQVNGGSGSFVFPGVLTNTAGTSAIGLVIQNVTGGAITFTGPINPGTTMGAGIRIQNNRGGTITFAGPSLRTRSSVGIDLQNNTGATIAFTGGGLDVFGSAGSVPFNATGGGTLSVLDPTNRNELSSLSAMALNVSGMTIDAAGLNFTKISAVGNGTGGFTPMSGILIASPSGSGGLTIRGTGTPGSGGNIQQLSGYGINVYGAAAPFPLQLSWVNVSSTGFGGLVTSGPVNARVRQSSFSYNYTGIAIDDGTGTGSTVTIDTVTITNPRGRGLAVTPRSGTSLAFTLRGSTIDGGLANADNELVYVSGSVPVTANVVGNTIRNGARSQFRLGDLVGGSLLFQDNTVSGSPYYDAVAVEASGGFAGTLTYDLVGNRIASPTRVVSIMADGTAGSSLSGRFRDNVIGTSGVPNSCNTGVLVSNFGAGTHTSLGTNNTFHGCAGVAAVLQNWSQPGSRSNATWRNNLMSGGGVAAQVEIVGSSPVQTMCADLSGNTMTATTLNLALSLGYGTIQLPGYTGATTGGSSTTHANILAYLRARNTASATADQASTSAGAVIQGAAAGISACPVPTF